MSDLDLNVKRHSELAKKHFDTALESLKRQKPDKAIPELLQALKLNPLFEEAKNALEEALESIEWTSFYFCPKCGKYIRPEKQYPELRISTICPRCGASLPTKREMILNYIEFSLKLIAFGMLPILILIFCGMPYIQHSPPYSITIKWSPLPLGIISALTFTPAIFLFLLLINDPEAYTLGFIASTLNSIENPILRFITSALFLFLTMYVYFFLIFTPMITMHPSGLWMRRNHQKKIVICSFLFTGLIIIIRTSSGVFY